MKKLLPLVAVVLFAAGLSTGCAKYYRVHDTATDKTYYTKNVKHKGGAVRFEDAQTGDSVNVQNAEITKVSKNQFKSATGH